MNIRKSMIIASMAIVLVSACADKKSKEVKADAEADVKAQTELNKEVSEKEEEMQATKQRVTDSLRKVDSLQQVKAHGHAH